MGKIIWITGAGSGIGEAIAKAYDQAGNTLILSGRNEENLNLVAAHIGCQTEISILDVTNEEAVETEVQIMIGKFGRIDILVNNAGVSQRGLASETATHVGRSIMDVNFFGAVHMTRALLPHFRRQEKSNIVVISSLSGKFGWPERSFYAASKHALHGYFETVELENAQYGLHVLLACPGRVQTDISRNALTADGKKHNNMDQGQLNGISPEKCAVAIIKGVEKGKHEIYIGKADILMVYFKRYFPALFRFLARRVKPS